MKKSIMDRTSEVKKKIDQIEFDMEQIGNFLVASSSKKKTKLTFNELIAAEPKIRILKWFYSERLYDAMIESVLKTLKCLAESCGFTLSESLSDDVELDMNDSTSTNGLLDYMRIKSGEVLIRPNSSKKSSPNNNGALRAISASAWTNERKLDKAYLQ